MRVLAAVAVVFCVSVSLARDEPTPDTPKRGNREVIISLANTPKSVADQLKVGSHIDIIVEEPGAAPVHTVFPAKRVHATADDKRKKDGHTVTVTLTGAQAAAFDILKESGTVIIAMHKPSASTTKK